MEVTLDMGKNIVQTLKDLAAKEKSEFDLVALKMLELGLRIYLSSKESAKDGDEINLFNLSLENNFLIKEMLGHVFNKERSQIKAYDSSAAISVFENMVKAFSKGKKAI
jgi:hypothetical protein